MTLAMRPEPPKKVSDVATQLEQWSALVENLEKFGDSYALNLPFRVTALRTIMHHANDWFDSWQAECYKTPDSLNMEAYLKLYRKCEDWARKKRLDADTRAVNQEIGGVDKGGEEGGEHEGYYDGDGNWWDTSSRDGCTVPT